jgi:adenosylcobinamide-phosphate synthase
MTISLRSIAKKIMSPLILITACILDLVLGDPRWLPHPVVLMGRLILILERFFRRIVHTPNGMRLAGLLITLIVVLLSYGLTLLLIRTAGGIHAALGWAVSAFLIYTTLAARSLHGEASKVKRNLEEGDIDAARRSLAGIVGRETQDLSDREIIRAAVETVSENTSDGVIAPLFYLIIGGPPAAMAYKATNTLDSMLGYKNERFRDMGWFPARLDDLANFIPARITGFLMVTASLLLNLSARDAFRIMRRDGAKHTSPNAGIPEAAAAGALGVQLGGMNFYMGAPSEKPLIGEAKRTLTTKSIENAVTLMYAVFFLMVVVSIGIGILI